VVIQAIVADPAVLRPGASATVTVLATDAAGGTLTATWSAASGLLSSGTGNPVTWTAPDAVGSYIINVTVTNDAGASASGAASLLVSVSPAGPVITSVSPSEAGLGARIRVIGDGFGATQGTSTLVVGGAPAAIESWSNTDITAVVPATAQNGEVRAVVGGVAGSSGRFHLLWSAQNPTNVGIAEAADEQLLPQIASDGAGGAIIVWQDRRDGNFDIFAQRVNAAGVAQWPQNGVPVCQAPQDQTSPQIVSDGAGGAIIVWEDMRNGNLDLWAQRLNASGAVEWMTNGVQICGEAGTQQAARLVSDGVGGAIIVWEDNRNSDSDIFAQRVTAAGLVQWGGGGLPIALKSDFQLHPRIASDGAGGAIIVWLDLQLGNGDIYGQRVNASGNALWNFNGNEMGILSDFSAPQVISDGFGGVLIATHLIVPPYGDSDIFVQRVDAAGQFLWPFPGVVACAAVQNQESPQLVSDGLGGAIVAWEDFRDGVTRDIFAQHVSSAGAVQWTQDGVPVCLADGDQVAPRLVPDDSGGAIVVWGDTRNGNADLFSQRLNPTGVSQWLTDGTAITVAANGQTLPQAIPDGWGGAIFVWQDLRNGGISDIFAQGISPAGRP
jgi:hypothetical protein